MIVLELIQQIYKSISQNHALKLDLSKAFNQIKQNLVTYPLRHMNLLEFFVQFIQKSIFATQIAIQFNQQRRTPYFKLTRGLYSGDPMSPFLSIICMQDFSTLIELGIEDGWQKQIYIHNNMLKISHLIFDDDIILFSKGAFQISGNSKFALIILSSHRADG